MALVGSCWVGLFQGHRRFVLKASFWQSPATQSVRNTQECRESSRRPATPPVGRAAGRTSTACQRAWQIRSPAAHPAAMGGCFPWVWVADLGNGLHVLGDGPARRGGVLMMRPFTLRVLKPLAPVVLRLPACMTRATGSYFGSAWVARSAARRRCPLSNASLSCARTWGQASSGSHKK